MSMTERELQTLENLGHGDAAEEIRELRGDLAALRNDLSDALDCKNGTGPTALSLLIEERDSLRAELAASRHELVGAKKSARAQARIIESLQQQRAHLNAQRDQWIEARNTLDSERAANATLTEELAASREREARLREALDKIAWGRAPGPLDNKLAQQYEQIAVAALAEGAQG